MRYCDMDKFYVLEITVKSLRRNIFAGMKEYLLNHTKP